jgi:plastocyanin
MKHSHYSLIALAGIAVVGISSFAMLGLHQNQSEPRLEITDLRPTYVQGDLVTISVNYDGKKSGCQIPKIQIANKTNPSQIFVDYAGGYHPDCPSRSQVEFYAGVYDGKPITHSQDFHVLVALGNVIIEKDIPVIYDPDEKFYTSIDFPDMEPTYPVNTAVNFTISLRGHGLFNAGLIPQVQILDQRGSTIWASFDHPVVTCCPRELSDLSRDFSLSNIGNPLIIKSAGTYTVQANYEATITQKSFEVVLPEIHCNDVPKFNTNITLRKYTWIAVSQIKQPFKEDCIDVENIIPRTPKLAYAMLGADGCQDDTILCTIPKGVSIDMFVTDTDLVATDFEQYKMTLSNDEAQSIAKKLGITSQKATPYKVLKYNDKYYLLFFYTMDESPNPEAVMEFDPPTSYIPVKLEKGQSINYTILVKMLSTFGKDKAQIDFTGGVWTADSMLDVKLEPSRLELGERQQSKINMTISADKDARDGVYQTWVRGKIGDSYVGPWNHIIEFPNIQIGNSDWMIINPSGDGQSSMGGKSPPDWLRTEIRTDQDFYKNKNQTEINVVLINTSDQQVTLDSNRDLMVTISGPVINNAVKPIYGIRAYSYDSKNQITLGPKSELILARPFYWNQTKFSESTQYSGAEPGIYAIESYFSGYSPSVFYSQKRIGIGLESDQSLLDIPKDDSFRGMTIKIPENASNAEPGTIQIDDVTVTAGTPIRWKNEDTTMHSATAKPVHDVVEFDTDLIPPNKYSIPIMITKPGKYDYYDVLHPWIQGKIIVKSKK